jgi:poly-beta-1,6-N-acetyl-D-glucosamine synthase
MNAVTTSGRDSLPPRGGHSGNASTIAGGRLDGGLAAVPPWPERGREEPDLHSSTRIGMGHVGGEVRVSAVGRHRKSALGADALRERSGTVPHRTAAVPIPGFLGDTAAGGMAGDMRFAGLEAPLSFYALVLEKRLAAMPAVDEQEPEAYTAPSSRRRRPQVTVLIPAHNEEANVAATIACVLAQEWTPDRVLVICDNCTDDTEAIARKAGAETYVTVRNTHMKAGGLNQALSVMMPGMAENDLILAIDADTLISQNFISEAAARFSQDRRLGGVSGVYAGKPGGYFVGWCQRNEFARWGFDSRQQSGRATCLSGAASIFTVGALRRVMAARAAGHIKGGPYVYNTDNFTEDFELSQALLHSGSKIANLLNVHIETAIKPTWTELHTQRLRWNRGITETLCAFGFTRHTRQMWVRWAVYTLSVLTLPLSLFLVSERVTSGAGFHMNTWMAFWIIVTIVIGVHKAVTIGQTRGLRSAIAAALILIELPYDTFLHVTFVRSLWEGLTATSKQWR